MTGTGHRISFTTINKVTGMDSRMSSKTIHLCVWTTAQDTTILDDLRASRGRGGRLGSPGEC